MNCRLLSSLLVSLLSSGMSICGIQQPAESAWLGVALPSPGLNRPESIYRAGAFPPMPVQPSQGREASADIKGPTRKRQEFSKTSASCQIQALALVYPGVYPDSKKVAFSSGLSFCKLLKLNGEPRWNRTSDPLLKRQML